MKTLTYRCAWKVSKQFLRSRCWTPGGDIYPATQLQCSLCNHGVTMLITVQPSDSTGHILWQFQFSVFQAISGRKSQKIHGHNYQQLLKCNGAKVINSRKEKAHHQFKTRLQAGSWTGICISAQMERHIPADAASQTVMPSQQKSMEKGC